MASKKGVGSSKNGRDSESKRSFIRKTLTKLTKNKSLSTLAISPVS